MFERASGVNFIEQGLDHMCLKAWYSVCTHRCFNACVHQTPFQQYLDINYRICTRVQDTN